MKIAFVLSVICFIVACYLLVQAVYKYQSKAVAVYGLFLMFVSFLLSLPFIMFWTIYLWQHNRIMLMLILVGFVAIYFYGKIGSSKIKNKYGGI